MKKIIVALIIFVGLAIGVTTGLILQKNKWNKNNFSASNLENLNSDTNNGQDKVEQEKELQENIEYHQNVNDNTPGVSLTDFYDENDLIWEQIEYSEDTIEGWYYQIKGLKNKEVEKKVNEKLKKSAIVTAKNRYSLSKNKENKLKFKQYKMSSFSNVLSVANLLENNYYESQNTFVSLDLNTGNELKIEDLFTKDADILGTIRHAFYSQLGYDLVYDDHSTIYQNVDEIELQKIIKEYKTTEYINFGFTPEILIVILRDKEVRIPFSIDIAIYSRFLSKESLFENDNIGFKNIHVFSNINPDNLTKEIVRKQKGNVIVDYTITSYLKNFKDAENKVIKDLKDKIEEDIRIINEQLPEGKVAYFENSFTIHEIGGDENFVEEDIFDKKDNEVDEFDNYLKLDDVFILCPYNPSYTVINKDEYEKFYEKRVNDGFSCRIEWYSLMMDRDYNYYNYYNELSYCKCEDITFSSYNYSKDGNFLNFASGGNGWKYILKDGISEKEFKKLLWSKEYEGSPTEEELANIFVEMRTRVSSNLCLNFYYKYYHKATNYYQDKYLYSYTSRYHEIRTDLPYMNYYIEI